MLAASSVEFNLKTPFHLLSKIKNLTVNEKWCTERDLNSHRLTPTTPST
jgi:hypothetical protein